MWGLFQAYACSYCTARFDVLMRMKDVLVWASPNSYLPDLPLGNSSIFLHPESTHSDMGRLKGRLSSKVALSIGLSAHIHALCNDQTG